MERYWSSVIRENQKDFARIQEANDGPVEEAMRDHTCPDVVEMFYSVDDVIQLVREAISVSGV